METMCNKWKSNTNGDSSASLTDVEGHVRFFFLLSQAARLTLHVSAGGEGEVFDIWCIVQSLRTSHWMLRVVFTIHVWVCYVIVYIQLIYMCVDFVNK